MKRLIQVFLCLFMITACQSTKQEPTVEITYDRVAGLQELNYDTLLEKLNSPIDFVVYIGRDDCGDCKMFKPYLEEYLTNHPDLGIYYLDIKSFRDAAYQEDASQEQKEFYDHLKEKLEFAWTPTLARYANGKKIESFEFLDSSFGRYDPENEEQQRKLAKFVAEFENWMDTNLKIDQM